jgi:hypothetical protein
MKSHANVYFLVEIPKILRSAVTISLMPPES